MNEKACILVVDDNTSLVRLAAVLLEKSGYKVLSAFDGQAGLRIAREELPDLIILDIVMPKMDGYEVARLLQDDPRTSSIPLLMLTVKGQVDDPELGEQALEQGIQERMDAYEAGAVEFMSKPIKAKELLGRVQAILWLDHLPLGGDLEIERPQPWRPALPLVNLVLDAKTEGDGNGRK